MAVDDLLDRRPFADTAARYVDAGWSVLVLPAGAKYPPLTGFTGAGEDADREQVARWVADYPMGNIGLRMPPGVIGIDVDNYGDKRGAESLAELVAKCGPLPPTWTSTSRAGGVSGIRFFRVPVGM